VFEADEVYFMATQVLRREDRPDFSFNVAEQEGYFHIPWRLLGGRCHFS
jgi:hypothetical protein